MPRLPVLDRDDLTGRGRTVFDSIVSGPRGRVEGPLNVWLYSPELAQNAQALGAFCRYRTGLPARLSELAILVTGAHWRAGFEWHVHAPIGLAAGLDPDAVEALRLGGTPSFAREDEAAVHAFARELLEPHVFRRLEELPEARAVSDITYARAEAALGRIGVVELVGVLGYYGLMSMTINAFEVPVPHGAPEPFAAP